MRLHSVRFFWAALFMFMMSAPSCYAQAKEPQFNLLILDSQKGNPYDEVRASLLSTLKGFGYVEGQNLHTTLLVTGNDAQVGQKILADELKRKQYAAVFVGGTVATIAGKNLLLGDQRYPVIFASPTDPVGIGVIKDFNSPPFANFTGVCYPVPPKARFKFIRRLLPSAKTFGLIYADMPQSHSYNRWLTELIASTPEFADIKILFREVPLITGENGDKKMAESAIPLIKELDGKVDAFIKPNDQMGTRKQFAEVLFHSASKPLIGITKDDVMAQWGSTAVIYPSHASIGEQAAAMLKGVFEGKPISAITPEWPKKYGFAIDLPKARQFKIDVPVELLQLAGENIVK